MVGAVNQCLAGRGNDTFNTISLRTWEQSKQRQHTDRSIDPDDDSYHGPDQPFLPRVYAMASISAVLIALCTFFHFSSAQGSTTISTVYVTCSCAEQLASSGLRFTSPSRSGLLPAGTLICKTLTLFMLVFVADDVDS